MLAMVLAVGIGKIAGLRTVMAPTAVSWAASQGWLDVREKRLGFLAKPMTSRILTVLALLELVGDKLPFTPSRTVPPQFAGRVVSGALSGAAIGSSGGSLTGGLVAGAAGAVIGTLGGRAIRGKLAEAFGRDWPAALIEDTAAIAGALLTVRLSRSAN